MAKVKTKYICNDCGYESAKWLGRCPSCSAWNTFEEAVIQTEKTGQRASISVNAKAKRITEVEAITNERYSTDISELDRVLGGGVVTDSIVLLSAEPGTGKSTVLIQAAHNLGKKGKKTLYFSGEESESQIKGRGKRLFGEELSDNIFVKSTNSMDEIMQIVEDEKPDMIVVDSIQTVSLQACLPSRAGGGVQVTECTNVLIHIAKTKKIPVFVVGQVTKNNELAGVKYLEHAVDVVLFLEGDKNLQLRFCRALKNRFGSTEEIGIFEMTGKGLRSMENPNELFTTKRDVDMIGCSLVSVSEGTRTFVVEVQSLVTKSVYGMPIRNAIGLNKEYVRILSAMLEARTNVNVANSDINLQVVGGLYIKDVAANLGIIMSIVSSYINRPIPQGYVFIGEVGLTGEITNVQYLSSRVKAIDRYGFKKVFIPHGALSEDINVENVEVVEVRTLQDVINRVFDMKSAK